MQPKLTFAEQLRLYELRDKFEKNHTQRSKKELTLLQKLENKLSS